MKLAEMGRIWALALLLLAGCARVAQPCEPPAGLEARQEARVPLLDHHQHLLSRGARDTTFAFMRSIGVTPQREDEPPVDADGLVRMLDEAGIRQALVLSDAYYFARVPAERSGEYARVRAENDWTLAQIGRHPALAFRLGFLGRNTERLQLLRKFTTLSGVGNRHLVLLEF